MNKSLKAKVKNYIENPTTECAWLLFKQPKMPKSLIEKQLNKNIKEINNK